MSFSISPTTAVSGATITAQGTGTKKKAARIRIDGILVIEFNMPANGSFAKLITVPDKPDGIYSVVLQQVRTDGVWAQTASTSLTVKNAVTPPPPPTGFVTVIGRNLTKSGATWRINGASILFGLDNADRDTTAAVNADLNTVRIVDYLQGTTNPLTDSRWTKVDALITSAKAKGLSVILDLSTYRNYLLSQGQNPYTVDWLPFINFVGSRYKNETAIAVISIAGEIEGSGDAAIRAQHVAFFNRVVPQIHTAFPNHVISCGGLLQYGWNGVDWKGIFTTVNLPAVHVYSQGDIDYLPTIRDWCVANNKPLLIEEFGQQQSVGDSSRATYFTEMYQRGITLGTVGEAFWNLGPDVRSDTFDVNTQTPLTWSAVKRIPVSPPPLTGFVTRNGKQLLLNGQPYRFAGFNIYNANSRDNCWYPLGYNNSALDDALTAIGSGQNAIRAWFFQRLATTNGVRDWAAFDHTIAVAKAHNIKIIATLADQWGACDTDAGGTAFKGDSWYTTGYKTTIGSETPKTYRDWVAEIVTRYKNEPTILAWQLMNEAEIRSDINSTCTVGGAAILKTWATDVSGLIKSIDTNHLVSLGTLGGGQCGMQDGDYQLIHDIPTIDLCEYHDYLPENMPGDQWNGLARRIAQANALNKPIFVGETGQKNLSLADRATLFRTKFSTQFSAGVVGELIWALRIDSQGGSSTTNYDMGPTDPAVPLFGQFVNGSITPPPTDSAPIVTLTSITPNASGADFKWHVSEGAKGWIEFGFDANYGRETNHENSFTYQDHVQSITGQPAATTIFYRIVAEDTMAQRGYLTGQFNTTGTTPPPLPSPTVPPAPSNLAATPGDKKVTLGWGA